jgi:2'-5' RNA ligase
VTVRFIGHVDAGRMATVVEALRPSLAIDRFALTVAGAGVFPPKGPPRVVWAGLSSGREQLTAVEQVVRDRLAVAGVDPEVRLFNPHLTLARVRDAGGLRAEALLDDLAGTVLGTSPVDAITLFESRLSPKGPRYLAIHRTLLA